jgi:sec-independent protein translocase protein TatB
MFNLGFSELLLLGVIALIFIGPKQLPEMARTVGRLLNELKRASSDFQQSFTDPLKDDLINRIEETRSQHAEQPAPDPEVNTGDPNLPHPPIPPRGEDQS